MSSSTLPQPPDTTELTEPVNEASKEVASAPEYTIQPITLSMRAETLLTLVHEKHGSKAAQDARQAMLFIVRRRESSNPYSVSDLARHFRNFLWGIGITLSDF